MTLYVLVLLVVGAPRSATITMTISGLTPHKVVDIELECEIDAEAYRVQIIVLVSSQDKYRTSTAKFL